MGRPSSKTYAEVERVRLTDQLLHLVIAGQPVSRAAEQLGLNYNTALRWYHDALKKVYDDNAAAREEALGRELKTLDMLQRALWPQALRGHVRSVEVMLAVMDRRSKYLGLDAAIKVQFETGNVDAAMNKISKIIDGEVAAAQAVPLLRAAPDAP